MISSPLPHSSSMQLIVVSTLGYRFLQRCSRKWYRQSISPQDKNATLINYQLPRVQAFINYGHAMLPDEALFISAVDCNMCMEHSWHIYSSCCSSDPLRCCFQPYNEGLLPYHHMFSCMQLIVVSTPLAVNNEGLWLQLDRRKVNRELEK
jgi:hypothetical protein